MNSKLVLIYLFIITEIFASNIGNYLIFDNPSKLVILNKFKQPINEKERGLFVKNKPLLVTKQNGILNDGVRGYTEIEINGNKYYLLKELGGKYYQQNDAGLPKVYNNKKYYYDTLKILTENGNGVFEIDKKTKKKLKAGSLIIRVFEDGNLYYVKFFDNGYGWMQFGKYNKDYELLKTENINTNRFTKSLIAKIKEFFKNSDKLNDKIFSELNKVKNKKLDTPKWNLLISDKRIIATLNYSLEKFNESNIQLVNKLETIVLGTGLKVRLNKNNIEITE